MKVSLAILALVPCAYGSGWLSWFGGAPIDGGESLSNVSDNLESSEALTVVSTSEIPIPDTESISDEKESDSIVDDDDETKSKVSANAGTQSGSYFGSIFSWLYTETVEEENIPDDLDGRLEMSDPSSDLQNGTVFDADQMENVVSRFARLDINNMPPQNLTTRVEDGTERENAIPTPAPNSYQAISNKINEKLEKKLKDTKNSKLSDHELNCDIVQSFITKERKNLKPKAGFFKKTKGDRKIFIYSNKFNEQ